MRSLLLAALALTGAASTLAISTPASAQDVAFRGIRIEGNAGWDQYRDHGTDNGKFAFGGEAGFDGQIGNKIVIGPEFNYWRPNNDRNTIAYNTDSGNFAVHQQRQEFGGAIRAGYLVTPDLLVYGKGGFVRGDQRSALFGPDGAVIGGRRGYVDGYQYGGGIEYTLHDRVSFVPTGVYVSAQYVRDEFDNHTSDQHAMGGIGFRFR